MAKTRYLIIGYPRSGTTVIHLLLKGHPNIAALNDELKVEAFFKKGIATFTFENDLVDEKRRGVSLLFDAVSSISADGRTTACGAKFCCNSPERARVLVDRLRKDLADLKIILMVRSDLVTQYGSRINSRKTGIYHWWYKGA